MSRAARQPRDVTLTRRLRAETVGRDVETVARNAFARAGFADPTLVLRWRDIVGADVARMTRPLRLNEGDSGGVLTLKVEPAASVFILHQARGLCDRINVYFGRNAIQRLRIVQGELMVTRTASPEERSRCEPPADDPSLRFHGPARLGAALIELATSRRKGAPAQGD